MWTPNDQCIYHSWIIGAAVVNAFYSPNRNQIGKPTLPLSACIQPLTLAQETPSLIPERRVGSSLFHVALWPTSRVVGWKGHRGTIRECI